MKLIKSILLAKQLSKMKRDNVYIAFNSQPKTAPSYHQEPRNLIPEGDDAALGQATRGCDHN